MNYKILSFIFFLSALSSSFAQKIDKVILEYEHPYNNEYGYLRIELNQNNSGCTISNIKLGKGGRIILMLNPEKKIPKEIIDCDSFDSIKKLISDFEKFSTKKMLGYNGILDPRMFKLTLVNSDNKTRKYESNIGWSFKTKDVELKMFNKIIKSTLTLAGYKWRRVL